MIEPTPISKGGRASTAQVGDEVVRLLREG
jgi:hypothetical protein